MIDRIHHVAIAVRDADKALGFYRDIMGLEVTADGEIADQGVRAVRLALGESEIELVQPTGRDGSVAEFIESRGEGLHHICLNTDDVAAELARAREEGVQLLDVAPRAALGTEVAFVHPRSAHGALIGFAKTTSGSSVSSAKGFDHLAVSVRDLDEAAASWKRLAGLELVNTIEAPVMKLGQVPCGQCTIELIAPAGPDSPIAKRLDEVGEQANSMVAIEVDDIEAEVARYRAAGITLDDPGPGILPNSVRSAISPDQAFGLSVQLIAFGG